MTPAWYADWRHEAVHQLQAKNEKLDRELGLLSWPRYDYDVEKQSLTFSENGRTRLVAEIQIVGTTGSKDWLWAWANDHWPEPACVLSHRVREFGIEQNIDELIQEYVDDEDLNSLGWELAAVAARVTESLGAYRPPSETGALFLLITSARLVS